MSEGKLPVRVKLGFGVADLGGSLFFTAMGFWSLAFLTDVVGILPAAAGAAVMVGKLWDAVTDPLMGYLSDRTRTRWGRRRPYLIFGALPLTLAMWFFFTKPAEHSQGWLLAWASLALCLLNTAYTVVNIPYSALTPDLTDDYHERSSLAGYRFGFAAIGTLIGAVAVLPLVGLFPTRAAGFSAVGAFLGLLMGLTTLITAFSVREGDHSATPIPHEGFFETFFVVFKNRPYVILLFTYACNLTALAFLQTIIVYYFKYLYRNEGMATLAMGILLVVAMPFIPISVLVSKRIGKKRSYQLCFVLLACSCLAIWAFAHRLGMGFFLGVMFVAGAGLGFGWAAPWAMIPDAVEYDAVTTGKRKEGAFYGMWTFTSKVGTSLAVFLVGLILQWGGYVANLAEQSERALGTIRLIVGPIPASVFLAGLALIERYPLDETAYLALMRTQAAQPDAIAASKARPEDATTRP